jgi:NCS1 family nucleobase:cation symporter-1
MSKPASQTPASTDEGYVFAGHAEPLATRPDAVGTIETHGIDVIPLSERHGRPGGMFGLWFGSNLIFTYLLSGAILIQLGLSLVTSIAIVAVCDLAWILVGVMSVPGPKTGTATLVISRAQYGIQGNKLSCLFSWVLNVAYEGVDFAIAALAAYSLATYAGWHLDTLWKTVLLFVIIGGAFALGLFGHATIMYFQKVFAWVLGIASVFFLIFVLPHVHLSYVPAKPPHGSVLTAAVLIGITVILSGPLSYTVGSDYSRYLPPESSAKQVILYTTIGGYLPSVALTLIGVLAATVVNPSDLTTSMRPIVPAWFYPVYLLVIIFGLIANSVLSVYSSGFSLQSMGVRIRRSRTIWFDVVLGSAVAVYGVLIASNFLTTLQNFLSWSVYWYAPFFGIYMVEMLRSRGEYDGEELFHVGGRYWFKDGFRWRGVIALVGGMVVSVLTSDTPYLKGAISTHVLSGGDLSAVGGFVIGAGLYLVLCVIPDRSRAGDPSVPLNDPDPAKIGM